MILETYNFFPVPYVICISSSGQTILTANSNVSKLKEVFR